MPGKRELQPVLDSHGRIAGFFTWQRTYPMTCTLRRLIPLIGAIAIVLVGFAGFSLRQLRRARRQLAESEEFARHAADRDKLTGLPNHAKTLELLDLALAERMPNEITTFGLIAIDGMADINATLGVLASDDLYTAVAERLQETLPANATCGRIGSNEFAVTVTTSPDADINAMMRDTMNAIARPHWVDTVVRVSAHAGFAQAPEHAATRGELTRRAELAVRQAAKKGPGVIVGFDPSIDTVSDDERFIQRELPRALSANELELHYQPIVAAAGRPRRRGRSAAALEPRGARTDRPGVVHPGRRADGPDGSTRRLRAAPCPEGGQAMARPRRGGQPVAAAGARPRHRRPGAFGAGRKRRSAVTADRWRSPRAC